jgi:hypothetical protein
LLLDIVNIPSKPGLPSSTYFSNSILENRGDFLNVQLKKIHFSKLLSLKTKKNKTKKLKKITTSKNQSSNFKWNISQVKHSQ